MNFQFQDYKSKVEKIFTTQKSMAHIGAKLVDAQPDYCEIHVPDRQYIRHSAFP